MVVCLIGYSIDINLYSVFHNDSLGIPMLTLKNNQVNAATSLYYWDRFTAVDSYLDSSTWIFQSSDSYLGRAKEDQYGYSPAYCFTSYNFDKINNTYSDPSNLDGLLVGCTYYRSYTTYVLKYYVTRVVEATNSYGVRTETFYGSIHRKNTSDNTLFAKVKGTINQSNIIARENTYPTDGLHTDGYWYVRKGLAGYSPEFTINAPLQNNIYGKTSIVPSITVKDDDDKTLTCKYFLDSESTAREVKNITNSQVSKIVNFAPIDITMLVNSEHSLRFEISDGTDTVINTVVFYVDKTSPIISNIISSSTDKTITILVTSTDEGFGLDRNPYKFTLSSMSSAWISDSKFTFESLIPNSSYPVKTEVKDAAGNITSSVSNVITKAQIPEISLSNIASSSVDLNIVSDNPASTQYQIMCNSKFVDSNGDLTDVPSWITITNNKIGVTGLTSNTVYIFRVKAKNLEGIETLLSSPVEFIKEAKNLISPVNLVSNPSSTSVLLTWDSVIGASEYEIEIDGVVKAVKTTTFTHSNLVPNTQHSYRIRAKNSFGLSDWSPYITAITGSSIPGNVQNIKSYPTNTTVSVTWDADNNAQGYEIDFAGTVISNIRNTFYAIAALSPQTQYSFRIRSINAVGGSSWSNYEVINTYLLNTPKNIKSIAGEKEVTLNWDADDRATSYEIEVNGSAPVTIITNSYKHTGLIEETEYSYRIRSKNTQGTSAWSNPIKVSTLPQKPGIPSGLRAYTDENIITLVWKSVNQAIGYDVELDGIIIDNGDSTTYIHEDLQPTSTHTYRVRAKNTATEGEWTEIIVIKTMVGKPIVPKDIKISTTPTITTLTWSPEEEALGYDIEVDEVIASNITGTSYRHRRLTPGTEHVYRIRTRNIAGISPWSGYMINNSIRAVCRKDKEVDLGLTASNITDFSKYALTVTYNPDVIDVLDLSTLSPKIELAKGKVEGTGITITEYTPGKIIFVVDKPISPGESWSGVINSIKFNAKITGGTNIAYTVFSKSED